MSFHQFGLRWSEHQSNLISVFTSMLNSEFLVDVTISAEGRELHAHKIILSACSAYFESLFAAYPEKHAIVIMTDVKYADLKVIIDFMYYGEVSVSEDRLQCILETGRLLRVKGLIDAPITTRKRTVSEQDPLKMEADGETPPDNVVPADVPTGTQLQKQISKVTLAAKRRRLLVRQNSVKKDPGIRDDEYENPRVERQLSEPIRQSTSTCVPLKKQQSLPTPQTYENGSEKTAPDPNQNNDENLRTSHCPVVRQGPALSCNYCWNTIDDSGRISRRKTTYHCPECQTNLCIVPCFYEFHERLKTY